MSQDKRTWIISELYYPSDTSTGHILTAIAEGLSADSNVSVLTGPSSYWEKSTHYKLYETVNSVEINRVRIPYMDKNRTWKRVIRLFLISASLGYKALIKIPKGANILIVTNPIPLLLIITFLAKFKKYQVTILVHDVYPNNMVSAGLIKNEGVTYKVLNSIFSSTYKSAKNVIVLGRDMKEAMLKKSVSIIHIIENWSETDLITPEAKSHNELLKRLKIENKFVFLFAGNFGRVQGLDFLLDAVDKSTSKSIHFLFAGNGALQNSIKERANMYPEKYSMLGTFSRKEQKTVLNACDVGVVSLSAGMYGLGVPSKAYNLMAAGKPILYIGDKGSEIDLVIQEGSCGWSTQPESPENLSTLLDDISNTPKDKLAVVGNNALELARSRYTKSHSLEKFKDIF